MTKFFTLIFFTGLFFSFNLHGQDDIFQRDYTKADSIASMFPKHSLNDLRSLSYKLTNTLSTEEEKFRAIYKWVCNNIENDHSLYLSNKRKREKTTDPEELKAWNKEFRVKVFKTLREKHRTVCTGYAYLVQELSSFAGLNSKIIDGYGRTVEANIGGRGIVNHSWTGIQLNGKWYLCDPTWSSGAYNYGLGKFVKKFEASYFLADPALFARNHYPLDTAWMMVNNKPTLNQFLNAPIIYVGAFHHGVLPLFPETIEVNAANGDTVNFKFKTDNPQAIENIDLQIVRAGEPYVIKPPFTRDEAGVYVIHHAFQSTGRYIVHVRSNSDYLFTCNLTVQ